jgi:hypothetical protein
MIMSRYCGVVQARSLEDALGATCARPASLPCSDCGIALCSVHTERCDLCRAFFCPSCVSFHSAGHPKLVQMEPRKIVRKSA